jgi:N-acetylmuramic acid 6-phosphate etherase
MATDRAHELDRLSAAQIVGLISDADRHVAPAVAAQAEKIAHAIESIADRMRSGGRLFYAGAGTSGRIAMLDAAELPPTFGIEAGRVEVIMAGGEKAFFGAVEGAEDDQDAAIAEVAQRVGADDSLVGIAASGTTPFTVAAIRRANLSGALTVGITAVPNSPIARECDIPIVVQTGPEVILGSTRMKSGTAQKLVLNTISTGVMILLGRVYGNMMVEMPATNAKLRERAIFMVQSVANAPRSVAESAFAESGSVKVAIVMARKNVDRQRATELLQAARGNLREVLEH